MNRVVTAPVICFDMDGTLIDEHDGIHPADREILRTRRDLLLVACTGRIYSSVVASFRSNGLFQEEAVPFPMVTQNGSAVHLPGGRVARYHPFPRSVQDELLNIFMEFRQASFMLMEQSNLFLLWPSEFSLYWMNRFRTQWLPFDPTCRDRAIGKASCLCENEPVAQELRDRLRSVEVEVGRSISTVSDINPRGISKRTGVMELLEALCSQGSPIHAAGDGENDLDLFQAALVSFAPQTAPEAIRAQASEVVDVSRTGLLTPMLESAGCL